jgi:L-asparagine transporter-like permease
MRNKNYLIELIVPFLLIAVLALFLSPADLFMPMSQIAMLGVLLTVVFLIFAGFIWNEKAKDERESSHIQSAGRYSFLTGLIIAISGILWGSLAHNIDPWLVFTAIGMILTKVFFRLYKSKKN